MCDDYDQTNLKEQILRFIGQNEAVLKEILVYVIELAIKLSPFPLSVQRKNPRDAQALYNNIRQCMDRGQHKLLELSCEKVEGKKLTILAQEILAVQIYEKTSASGGSKRPGFTFEG